MSKELRKVLVYLGVFSLILLFSATLINTPVVAKEKDKSRRGEAFDNIAKELNLTEEQEKELKKHRRTHRKKMQKLVRKLQNKRTALHKELEKYKMNKRKVNNFVTIIKKLQGEILDLRIKGVFKTKGILTEEQFKKLHSLDERKGARKKLKKHRREKRKGRVEEE